MQKEVYAIVIDDEYGESVICIMDSIQEAKQILEKIKPLLLSFLKPFCVEPNSKKLFVVYEEYLDDDQKGNEKTILKVACTKNEAYNTTSLCTDCLISFTEYILNDTTPLFQGEYRKFLIKPPKEDLFIDEDYINYIKKMRENYST
jgi:hypothetical protein